MSNVAIVARVTVQKGRADEYVAAFGPLHAVASPVFTKLIATADVLIGGTLIATGLSGPGLP